MNLNNIARLAMAASGLSMLIFPEGVLLGRAMADKHGYDIDPDRELVALGAANIASGAFLGFAAGGSQSRTLINSASGGRTQVASLASIVFLVAFLAFGAEWLLPFPKVAIAAILIYVGFGIIEVAPVRRMFVQDPQSGWIAMMTSAAVMVIGVLPGILIGMTFSIAILLAGLARPHDALLGFRPDSTSPYEIGGDESVEGIPGLIIYRFYGPLIFANVGVFIERLKGHIDRQKESVRRVVIDAGAIPSIDLTAVEKLQPFLQRLADQGIEITVAGEPLSLQKITVASELEDLIPAEQAYPHVSDAVAEFKARAPSE